MAKKGKDVCVCVCAGICVSLFISVFSFFLSKQIWVVKIIGSYKHWHNVWSSLSSSPHSSSCGWDFVARWCRWRKVKSKLATMSCASFKSSYPPWWLATAPAPAHILSCPDLVGFFATHTHKKQNRLYVQHLAIKLIFNNSSTCSEHMLCGRFAPPPSCKDPKSQWKEDEQEEKTKTKLFVSFLLL